MVHRHKLERGSNVDQIVRNPSYSLQRRELNLTGLAVTVDVLLEEARKREPSYSDFALTLLETELSRRLIHGNDDFRVVIFYRKQVPEFP